MVIDNQNVAIKGELVKDLIDNFATFLSFVAGARISAVLLAKENIGFIPKIGKVTIGGTGLAVVYKVFTNVWPNTISRNGNIIVTGPTHIEAKIEGKLTDFIDLARELKQTKYGIMSNDFNSGFNPNKLIQVNPYFLENKNPLTMKYLLDPMEWKGTLSVTSEVKKINVDWSKPSPLYNAEIKSKLNSFILSPLENENFILEVLTDSLILEIIKIYFLIMLLILLVCKTVIKSDSFQLDFLNKYVLAQYFNLFLVKYINIWRKSSHFWIFFDLILLLIFSLTSFFALYKLRVLFL